MTKKDSVQQLLEHIDKLTICVTTDPRKDDQIMTQFCKESFGVHYIRWGHYDNTNLWFFSNQDDASYFALTWT